MTPLELHTFRTQYKVSPIAEILLDIVRINHDARVMQIMAHGTREKVATQMTLHTELMWLNDNGFVKLEADGRDKRTKLCKLSVKGKRYLEALFK